MPGGSAARGEWKLFQFVQPHSDRPLAVTDAGEVLRYGEILEAEALLQRHAGGRLLFLLCRNTAGGLLSYLGALKSDAVPLLLDADLPDAALRDLAERYHPACCAMPLEDRQRAFALFPAPGGGEALRDYALVPTGWESPPLAEPLKLLLSTSGSTGSPKLVRLSRENLESNAAAIAEYLAIDGRERALLSLPMYYAYGMSIVHSHLLRGASLLLTRRRVLERAFWELAQSGRATSFAGVPDTYELFDRLSMYALAPDSLRTLTQAGGKLRPELHRRLARWCRDTDRRFFVMYGQTEASPRMGYLPAEVSLEKCGSMGVAIPGGRLYLIDSGGAELREPGQTGELVYEGANVSLGYAERREDLLQGDQRHGVLKTGDLAYRDAEGFFYITGRKSRFIKLLGQRMSLDDIEQGLRAETGQDAACVDAAGVLRVFLCGMTEPVLANAQRYLFDHLRIPVKLVSFQAVPAIPKNAAGKVLYGALSG